MWNDGGRDGHKPPPAPNGDRNVKQAAGAAEGTADGQPFRTGEAPDLPDSLPAHVRADIDLYAVPRSTLARGHHFGIPRYPAHVEVGAAT